MEFDIELRKYFNVATLTAELSKEKRPWGTKKSKCVCACVCACARVCACVRVSSR